MKNSNNLIKIENILNHYLVTKTDSNNEKNWSKIKLDCPLKKDTEKSLDSVQYDTARNLTQRSTV